MRTPTKPHRLATALLMVAVTAGASAAAAQVTPTNGELQEAIRTLAIPSPYRISEQARSGTIRYRLHGTPGWAWPETGEQHVDMSAKTWC